MSAPTALPDEDRLDLPAGWKSRLLPRRGRRSGVPVDPDPKASADLREAIEPHRDGIRATVAQEFNTQFEPAASAYLNGAADARGAAVVSVLLDHAEQDWESRRSTQLVDAWRLEHGLDFAVCAFVERMSVQVRRHRHGDPHSFENLLLMDRRFRHTQLDDSETAAVARLRGWLAAADEVEYAKVVRAAAAHRGAAVSRIVATLLLPDETGWMDEVCADVKGHGPAYVQPDMLWHSFSAPEQFAAAGIDQIPAYQLSRHSVMGAMLDGLGVEVLPLVTATLDQHLSAADRRALLSVVALLPSRDAVDYLLDRLSEPFVLDAAVAAADRFPVRAMRSVARRAGAADAATRRQLTALAKTQQTRLAAVRERLDADECAVLDELVEAVETAAEASAEALPELLRNPPWLSKRPKAKPVVIDGLEAVDEPRLAWAEGEAEAWAAIGDGRMNGADRNWRYALAHPDRAAFTTMLAYAPMSIAADQYDRLRCGLITRDDEALRAILGRFGERAVEDVTDCAARNSLHRSAVLPVSSLRVARLAADWLVRLKSARTTAAAWLERHGADAARLLVPDALGAAKKPRQAAEAALLHVASRCGADLVREAADGYGEAAAAAIETLLDVDPMQPKVVKIPTPGTWADPALLPQVLLKGRERAVGVESMPHLITILAVTSLEDPYPGVAIVEEACDRESLREFSWALFERWLAAGAPAADGWALTQLAGFADDETVRRLTPMIRQWPGQSQHKRAVAGLEVLGAIGSEAALRAIHGISEKVKFKALKEKAREQIQSIAEGLGLTTDQLGDRLVPDFGLGADGSMRLDYGARQFTVGFDEQLKPFVSDSAGNPRKSLPKPGAKDDAEVAQTAYKRFAQLRKDVRTVAADQVARLERAMAEQRKWTVAEFREFFVDHPLTWHLARRLVWMAESDGRTTAFRLAEDKSAADVEDDEFKLPEDATVRLAHPVLLGAEAVETWATVLSDYEILQPFDQLGRPIMAFTAEELKTCRLERFEGATVETGRILGMTKRDWSRAAPEDAGVEPGISRRLPGGGRVVVHLDPGIAAGAVDAFPEQTLTEVRLAADAPYSFRRNHRPEFNPATVDAVTASEVLGALARLARTS